MSFKTVELRPNRNLLNPEFDGYKLSLEPTPLLKEELTSNKPAHLKQSDEQFSCLHAQLFGLQNLLIKDQFNLNSCYYVDQQWRINKIQWDALTGRLKPNDSVFQIPKERNNISGDYNVNFTFISEKYCILSDGIGNLFFIDTGNRKHDESWKIIHREKPIESLYNFMIQSARIDIIDETEQINILLYHIIQENNSFYSVLEWITYKITSRDIEYFARKQLKGKGSIKYAEIEFKNLALLLSTDKTFEFVLDTENPIIVPILNGVNSNDKKEFLFLWSQTNKEILLNFKKIEGSNYSEYTIETTDNSIKVLHKTEVLIDTELFAEFNKEGVAKAWENDQLHIKLPKSDEDQIWPYLFIDGPDESPEIVFKSESNQNPSNISTLESQFEECDFSVNGEQTEYFIVRYDRRSHEATHKIIAGNIPPLFNVTLNSDQLSSIILRYDVDAIVWTPPKSKSELDEWTLKHDGTLNAFGYVQASKQQKKFMSCSPDMAYSIICEPERHLFLYKNTYDTASGLRNRNGPKKSIGQQKLITLESTGEVLGMVVENEVTILLTEKYVLAIQTKMNTE